MRFRALPAFLCLILSAHAVALPAFFEVLKKEYNLKSESAASKASCQNCHTTPPKFNSYGKTVHDEVEKVGSFSSTVLRAVASVDSDGDGVSNGEELKAGTLPGDPKSKPATTQSAVVTTEPEVKSELVPKHSFHPAVSHFPLALFAISALFAVLAKRKDSELYVKASVLNLGTGLLLAIVTIATGIIAMLRLGYGLEGKMLVHLLLASASVLIGLAAYTQRSKSTYLPLLVLCGILVLAAGHFGGDMVYGS